MDSLVRSLERVVEAGEWFVRTPSLRVLYIVTSGLLRNVVLQHVTATELLDANTSPFFVLEAPTEPESDGWSMRTGELRADWQHLIESAPTPAALAPLWAEQHGDTPLIRFGREVRAMTSDLRPPMTGVVIVLAPVWVRDADRWRDDLAILLDARSLCKARFVLVETDETHALPVVQALATLAEVVDARLDDAAIRRDMNATLEAARSAPRGATGHQLVGGAGPPVPPPPRKREAQLLSAERREELARQLGLSAAALDAEAMRQLRNLILSAAAAMRDGNLSDAVRLQIEARDFCVDNRLAREAVVNELVLGGYMLQAGHSEAALDVFRQGKRRAETATLLDMAVQAQMAAAACLLIMKRVDDAAAAYAEAGQLGAGGGSPALTVEAYRMCGQLLAANERMAEAAVAFRHAIAAADGGDEHGKANTSVVQAMRALAAIYRQHGPTQQAASLEAQVAAIERAAAGCPPPER